jgi:hypothetical protein
MVGVPCERFASGRVPERKIRSRRDVQQPGAIAVLLVCAFDCHRKHREAGKLVDGFDE